MNEGLSQRAALARARRPVVKIGSAVLAASAGEQGSGPRFDRQRFAALCDDLAGLARDRELVVVTSGAVALGVERLGLSGKPKEMALKQAAAAAGQSRLMRLYDDELDARGLRCAQVLLTHADIAHRGRYLNARHAMGELIGRRVIPVINENDVVSFEEIRFGDNDSLAAMVVDLVGADALVILTDAGGVFTADPRNVPGAQRLSLIEKVTPEIEALAAPPDGAGVGSGGMQSKLRAARRASEAGVPTAIVPGQPGVLPRLFAGEDVGTLIAPQGEPRNLRKRWMLALKPQGSLIVDPGARRAVVEGKKSLLPSGVQRVQGEFDAGDPIDLASPEGAPFARGLAVYGAGDMRRIAGQQSGDIEATLGYRLLDCVVHRDDLVVTA